MPIGKKSTKKATKSMPSISGRSFVGVDISDHSIKIVQISGRSQEQVKIENCAITPLPSGAVVDGKISNVESVVTTLQQTVSRMGGVSKNVILGIPNSATTVQMFSYNAESGMDLEAASELEVAQIAVVDEVNYDFQLIGTEDATAHNALLVLAKKEDVDPYLAALDDAGLSPVVVDVESTARINAYSYWINQYSPSTSNSIVAVIDIGEELSQALVLQAGAVLYKQEFPVGGKHLSREIQRTYQVGLEDAERMKMSPSKPQDYKNVQDVFNSQIAQEVQRVLQFFYSTVGSSQQVAQIFLTGGGSLCGALSADITSQTGVSAQVLHPIESVPTSGKVGQDQFKQNVARYTVAFGLALRGLV